MKISNNFAPGFKIVISIVFFAVVLILFYIFWYYSITKQAKVELLKIKEQLQSENIYTDWENIYFTGFPYRIEINLENLTIDYLSNRLDIKKIKAVFQPWNKRHIILLSNKLEIQNNLIGSITLIMENIKASYNHDKNMLIRFSLDTKNIKILKDNQLNTFSDIMFHLRKQKYSDVQFAIYIDNWFPPKYFVIGEKISSIILEGNIINISRLKFRDIKKWMRTDGGIDFKKIDGNLDNTEVNGEGFLGLDNNDNFIGSFVIRYKEISEIFKRLENHNIISSDINNALTIIADTSEALAELNNELPKISIRIQQGYIYIFGIKILKGPRLEDIKNF